MPVESIAELFHFSRLLQEPNIVVEMLKRVLKIPLRNA